MNASLTDSLLLESLGQGDAGSFEELFARYRPLVYGVTFRLTGDREEAEELTQDVFLKLYAHRFRSGKSHNLPAWLYRVATNLGYNSLRSHQRRQSRLERVANNSREDGSLSDPQAEALRQEEQYAVREIIGTLPENQASCLVLRQVGLSYAEIAQIVGVSHGSVGTLLARAERTFKERYLRSQSGAKAANETNQ
ncbi:MAG: sigma-70 family RNA polymerase sigma factor [Dehalococcoidia bacterium]|nr:sigma-70 family RNA polymerase sigma factor [Dehalococcoidia bacterium]